MRLLGRKMITWSSGSITTSCVGTTVWALLPSPRILILDEAASALDPESEAIFIRNLARIAAGRTVIIVSHRLSTLVHADQIFVFERGRLADAGPHGALLGRCEPYTDLWNQQTSHL